MNRLAQKKKVCALIPARLNSVRFPGKALKQIDGIPMVVRVLAAARTAVYLMPFTLRPTALRLLLFARHMDLRRFSPPIPIRIRPPAFRRR